MLFFILNKELLYIDLAVINLRGKDFALLLFMQSNNTAMDNKKESLILK